MGTGRTTLNPCSAGGVDRMEVLLTIAALTVEKQKT